MSVDAGIRASYEIWRFGLFFKLGASYLVTKNLCFESEIDPQNGYRPNTFVQIAGGLSYRFKLQ